MRKSTLFIVGILFLFQITLLEAQAPRGSFFDDALSAMDRAFNQGEFTPEDEYYLGRAVAANILAAYKPYTASPELTRYLNRICQTIVINSVQPAIFKDYSVIILDSPEFNAFASPGGHIFVTRSLIETAASEDMLAAVIAHELAHIMLRHGVSLIEDFRLNDEMAVMAEKARDLSGNFEAAAQLMIFRNSVSTVVDALFKNGYSQAQEFDADREAVALLAAAGFYPGALLEMLKALQQVQPSQKEKFSATHPSPEQRIANVTGWINRYRVEDTRSYRVRRFGTFKQLH
jgi:beta-barrel assembly-enhancing protease